MKKTLLATIVATLGGVLGGPVHAEPAVMIGISHNFGGATGVTFKLLSTRERNQAALAAGITYFPGASGSAWGADVGVGYTFRHGAVTLGYDWLNEQIQLGLGAANTKARNVVVEPTPAPAPEPVVAAAPQPMVKKPVKKPVKAPAPAPAPVAAAPIADPAPAPAPAPAPVSAPAPAPVPEPETCVSPRSAPMHKATVICDT